MDQPEADHGAAVAHQVPGLDLVLLPRGDPEGDQAPERRQGRRLCLEGVAAAHLQHHVDLACRRWRRGSPRQLLGARVDRGVGAELERQRPLLLAGGEARSPGRRRAAWRAARRGCRSRRRRPRPRPLALLQPGRDVEQAPGGQPLQQQRRGLVVVDRVGHRHQRRLRHGDLLGVAAVHQQRRDAAAVRGGAADLAAGHHRQLLLGEVVVAGHVGVGEVDPRARDTSTRTWPSPGLGIGQLGVLEHLGAAELLDLDSLHAPAESAPERPLRHVADSRRIDRLRLRQDAVRRARADARRLRRALLARRELLHRGPRGRPGRRRLRRRASSRCCEGRGVDTDDIERVEGGETFFWRGHYDYDLNTAHTDDTQLNVFGDFEPKLSEASRVRRHPLPRQHPARAAAPGAGPVRRRPLRGAGLDEPVDRDRAGLAGGRDRRGRLR